VPRLKLMVCWGMWARLVIVQVDVWAVLVVREGQLVQLGVIHSLERLGHELVSVGERAERVQLAEAKLAQLQLGVGRGGCS
jgi:hypothetical protein